MERWKWLATIAISACVGACLSLEVAHVSAAAKTPTLSALDYQEITQLLNRYAYGIDMCSNNGYDYADVFTPDGVFIDKNSDAGFKQGGRVLAKGREALATLIGDVYVKASSGWRIKSRTHVRNKAWHNPLLQTPDLN